MSSSSWKDWLKIPAKANATVIGNVTIPGTSLLKTGASQVSRSTISIVHGSTQRLIHRQKKVELQDPDECEHLRIDTSQTEPVCDDCGTMIKIVLKDGSGPKGESRCFHHNNNPRDISPDLRGLKIPESIQQIASSYYLKVIKYDDDTGEGDTRRKTRRRAIIAACVSQAYTDSGSPKAQQDIADMFGIDVSDLNKKGKKAMSQMITSPLGRHMASPMDHVPSMLKNVEYLNLGASAKGYIQKLWSYISDLSGQKDYDFDSRRPKSMAAALVYFYARLKLSKMGNNDKFDMVRFGAAVNVSTNTFQAISQSIAPTIVGAENLTL